MPKLSDKVKAKRRDAILDGVVRSLTRHGYAGTSMRTIAEESGLTKGGLYAYFDSKEAMLVALAERYFEQEVEYLDAARSAAPSDQLRAFVRRFAAPERDAALARTQRAILDLWSLAGDLPEVREALEKRYRRYRDTVAKVVRHGQRTGRFRTDIDAKSVAALLLAARDGLVFHRVKLQLPLTVGPLTDLLYTVLLDYLEQTDV